MSVRLAEKTGANCGEPLGYATRFQRGYDPRRGCGVKGRSGRKPNAFKALCRELASADNVLNALEAILGDVHHPAFMQALKFVTNYGYGPATRSHDTNARTDPSAPQRLVFGKREIIF